jgi:hypothetical protein
MHDQLTKWRDATSKRISSWETNGRNADRWYVDPGESRVLADLQGPGCINHIWFTQRENYREVLIKITWDNADRASVLVPLGDFFGLGHSIVNSYESLLFSASTNGNNVFNTGCALNSYVQMPFNERCVIELVNDSDKKHLQYFYIDYETYDEPLPDDTMYFHAEWRRQNPFGGWAHEIRVNTPEANVVNTERTAWNNNYVILETKGRGHYLGCNLSVTNFQGTWWGEGDDMIWVDGYKWPPDLHGTGSEDYLNQAWGMQPNAFLRHGSSIHERNTGGYQTSYVHHIENPVRYRKSIKVTIEHGHGNHLCNEMASTAYWYATEPAPAADVPTVEKRLFVPKQGKDFVNDESRQITTQKVKMTREMREMKKLVADRAKKVEKIQAQYEKDRAKVHKLGEE